MQEFCLKMIIFMHNICNSLLKLEEWVLSLLFGLWWKNYVCTAICGYDKVSWDMCMNIYCGGKKKARRMRHHIMIENYHFANFSLCSLFRYEYIMFK